MHGVRGVRIESVWSVFRDPGINKNEWDEDVNEVVKKKRKKHML